MWALFGYDEPNYTYTDNGKKLLKELAEIDDGPVYARCHHLLTSGDGTGRLKWGSTNAYSEDADGNPVYDWTILDRIFDAYMEAGVKPFVQAGFMPKALSTQPDPYEHDWPNGSIQTGWSFPPKDYGKWAELIFQWVTHCVERYGQEEVESWYWECWNEPDIFFWSGTMEEFIKLYDYTIDAVKRALPTARVGGPQSTGPEKEEGFVYLRSFLDHCVRGTNAATGEQGSPVEFLGFHTKGRAEWLDGHVRLCMQRAVTRVKNGFEIVAESGRLKDLPIILDEADPDGTAAISAKVSPENGFKNTEIYPAYNASFFKKLDVLSETMDVNLSIIGTWAFQFEDQPYFSGFRSLATNGIDKPILNLYRMMGKMRGDRVVVESTGAVSPDSVIEKGILDEPDVDAIAAVTDREATILAWHYHDEDDGRPVVDLTLAVSGLPTDGAVTCEHFRVDEQHSNAHTVWQEMGAPQDPTPEQYAKLETAGQLELVEMSDLEAEDQTLSLSLQMPRYSVALLRLRWYDA